MKTKEKVKVSSKPTIMGTTKKVSSAKLGEMVKNKTEAAEGEVVKKKKKKKSKEGGESKGAAAQRASNYNFPKDATTAKDHKKFRTTVRKKIASFQDRLALAKSGKGKESEKTVRKELAAYQAEVYLSAPEAE